MGLSHHSWDTMALKARGKTAGKINHSTGNNCGVLEQVSD
jgi:hypothetical protein